MYTQSRLNRSSLWTICRLIAQRIPSWILRSATCLSIALITGYLLFGANISTIKDGAYDYLLLLPLIAIMCKTLGDAEKVFNKYSKSQSHMLRNMAILTLRLLTIMTGTVVIVATIIARSSTA